jgi:guanyl-specific ribonuclease Sa
VRRLRRTRRPLIALVALVAALAIGYGVRALNDGSRHRHIAEVALSQLPPQAAQTVRLIAQGTTPGDGVVFDNAGHRLPAKTLGYYREYPVPPPGSSDRRIIAGGRDEFWYTPDAGKTLERVDPTK